MIKICKRRLAGWSRSLLLLALLRYGARSRSNIASNSVSKMLDSFIKPAACAQTVGDMAPSSSEGRRSSSGQLQAKRTALRFVERKHTQIVPPATTYLIEQGYC